MPRYFFHLGDGCDDMEGVELPDLPTARSQAIKLAGQLIVDDPELVSGGRDFRVSVADSQDQNLITIVVLTVEAPAIRATSATRATPVHA